MFVVTSWLIYDLAVGGDIRSQFGKSKQQYHNQRRTCQYFVNIWAVWSHGWNQNNDPQQTNKKMVRANPHTGPQSWICRRFVAQPAMKIVRGNIWVHGANQHYLNCNNVSKKKSRRFGGEMRHLNHTLKIIKAFRKFRTHKGQQHTPKNPTKIINWSVNYLAWKIVRPKTMVVFWWSFSLQ